MDFLSVLLVTITTAQWPLTFARHRQPSDRYWQLVVVQSFLCHSFCLLWYQHNELELTSILAPGIDLMNQRPCYFIAAVETCHYPVHGNAYYSWLLRLQNSFAVHTIATLQVVFTRCVLTWKCKWSQIHKPKGTRTLTLDRWHNTKWWHSVSHSYLVSKNIIKYLIVHYGHRQESEASSLHEAKTYCVSHHVNQTRV